MKKIFLFSCVCFFISCSSFKLKEHKLNIYVDILEKLDSHLYLETGDLYSCSVEIENNTDSTIRFWSMNCSWQSNFITNTSKIIILGKNCDRNFPEVFTLKKDSIVKYEGKILIPKPELLKNNDTLKLGFVYVKENEYSFSLDRHIDFRELIQPRKKEQKGVVWSNAFLISE